MESRLNRFFVKVTLWLAAEVLLTLIGLDNLADYSEFLFDARYQAQLSAIHFSIPG